ncbi:MAG: ATP-binding protein [Candidatus Cloacimonadota bacterium]|nr:ATP-binding protein [Candidatus Cloacimonadota bacterium]
MAEYWYIKPSYEDRTKIFLEKSPKPEISTDFQIDEHDFVNAGTASGEIKLSLKRLGVQSEILRRVAIAAYEAEINIAAHSKGGKIIADIFPELIHIKLQDKGPGLKDIEQCMEPGFSTANELVREMGFGAGLGLPNIKKNTDVLHIISEYGKSTFLEIMVFFE